MTEVPYPKRKRKPRKGTLTPRWEIRPGLQANRKNPASKPYPSGPAKAEPGLGGSEDMA
ncbi:MAG: hypothetical protein K9K64_02060 [Desulfohalobiaceae bacterium]|nr:hypothetical protein [Desulfohalobiaceae bacterium]